MNGNLFKVVGAVLVAVLALLIYASTFIVGQTQEALVLQFGRVRGLPKQAGLHFKIPFIENVVYVDKRILDLDLPVQEVIASDQKRLVVDTFTRYRIINPLLFYQSVNSIAGANLRLTSIVNSTTRSVLAEATFTAVVKDERDRLMRRIRDEVNQQAKGLGLEVVDVRLRRVDLPEQNSEAVYRRMKTEREREAADIRAQGSQIAQGIRARSDREVTVLLAEATRKSEELRGQGDAERNRIYADAYGRDPSFFSFYRSMQAYEAALKAGDTRLVLSPDSDFFRYFGHQSGRGVQGAGPQLSGPPASSGASARP
ncbi:protease modulator HflC [Chelatococcus reniformis]|uniref:Protein HflC n=1 Tax=Chelatococcus reniformis TaxID=1494448 RepID=A0A916XLL3_9HYPH|nr:protease modulator HflC [Chelatococcus reniformis]GGC84162.1 protein HflC [Chelatococcus reniformis]